MEASPWERRPILDALLAIIDGMPTGARLLDVGGGSAPYRELFGGWECVSSDEEHFAARESDQARNADQRTTARAEGSFDLVAMTYVLQRLREPETALRVALAALRPGGRLVLTAPFALELSENAPDYWRLTPSGLEQLLASAGFESITVRAANDSFTSLAHLMHKIGCRIGGNTQDGLDHDRADATVVLSDLADHVATLAPLDTVWTFPLSYVATARRPVQTA